MPSISTWSEKLRKGPDEHDQSKDADVVQGESTAAVLMMSAATSNSSPSRMLRPKPVRTTQWGDGDRGDRQRQQSPSHVLGRRRRVSVRLAVITGAIKWSDAIFAFGQVRRLRGDTHWLSP